MNALEESQCLRLPRSPSCSWITEPRLQVRAKAELEEELGEKKDLDCFFLPKKGLVETQL